ncbi:hypothetical protein LTR53_005935, partial [Teratosphaeriaceae sp. CCFEE 6253]
MFLDPEPKRQKAASPSPFLPPMAMDELADQRWRAMRKPLHERTKSQNNEQGRETDLGKPTIRLVRHSPTPSIRPRSSTSDADIEDVQVAKRVSLKRYKSNRAQSRLSLVQGASPAEQDGRVSKSTASTNEAQKLHLPATIALLPKSSTHAVPKTAWHRRSASSGNYSNSSTLQEGDTSLVASSRGSGRFSQGTTLRGTPTPYDTEHPKPIEEGGPVQGPAHALQTLQEASAEQETVRAVPPSVKSTSTGDQLGSGPSETSLADAQTQPSPPAYPDDPPDIPRKSSRRRSSASSAPAPLHIRKTSSSPAAEHRESQESDERFESAFPEPSSPIVVIYDSDSSIHPRSRSQPLRYTTSLESIQSRLQNATVIIPETGRGLANSSSWASLLPGSSTDTLPPLQVLKKRSNRRPTSLSLGSSSAFASGSRMASQDYDDLPYPRHQYSSHLSTIA